MCAIGEGHEWKKRPLIVHRWIGAIFDAKPAFYFRPTIEMSEFASAAFCFDRSEGGFATGRGGILRRKPAQIF